MVTLKNTHLTLGNAAAPIKVEVFLNLACPYCASFYELVDGALLQYINENKVELIVKHYDKPREMLLPGTLINLNLDYGNPAKTLDNIKSLFKEQETWDKLSSHGIKEYIKNNYGLKEEEPNIEISLQVTAEAIERRVKMVPTVFINDLEFQYPREIFSEELIQVLDQQLSKEKV
ncbi:thioredoxin domain-containing protein [Psychrobacillus sp. INOP01]|uniref:thioredoxin domain-containing protein n=1 Tax=Psychrobacillus sp. INOP01 TaxID=2829187 RepID=UPI001BA629CA|nr:thioredoxin domain-containing protein [Psychrobacillus sp. INOP01]QUG39980.1 thioredoxin domain-containing protein [Psychrobacillus sp. INOP01]